MYEDKTDERLVAEAGRAREIDSAPVEMTRRLKDSIEKLNRSTKKYSRILIWLTAIMTIAVIIQIILLIF